MLGSHSGLLIPIPTNLRISLPLPTDWWHAVLCSSLCHSPGGHCSIPRTTAGPPQWRKAFSQFQPAGPPPLHTPGMAPGSHKSVECAERSSQTQPSPRAAAQKSGRHFKGPKRDFQSSQSFNKKNWQCCYGAKALFNESLMSSFHKNEMVKLMIRSASVVYGHDYIYGQYQ